MSDFTRDARGNQCTVFEFVRNRIGHRRIVDGIVVVEDGREVNVEVCRIIFEWL